MKQYRVQLPPDARYSDWMDINVKCPYDYVLSIQFKEALTLEETREFMKQFTVVVE